MPKLTIIIPVGPSHEHIFHEAVASAEAQTVPCEIIVIHDRDGNGAGHARNQGIARTTTPYIAFLDADDVLDPHFAEICLGVLDQYAQSGNTDPRYVYTDWLGLHNVAHQAPDPCIAWTEKTFHLVTTVLPTERVRLIGGFDEVMTGVEDADFYVRLRLSGLCGIHVNAPLVSYREGGQRSIQARVSGQEALAQEYMTKRYGGYNLMGCCGDNTQLPPTPGNEPQDGWVLVQAQWHGNRTERGRVTGTLYPRTSHPHLMYLDPRDVEAAPHLWKRVQSPQQAANGVILKPEYRPSDGNWQDVMAGLFGGGQPQPVSQPVEYKPNRAQTSKASVVAKAQEWVKVEGDLG
jgi:hypothetical protein